MANSLKTTPLHAWHQSHGGRMVDFAGWSMPVQYTSIVEEHTATREAIGLFDISHMGRLEFSGPQALDFVNRLVTRRVADMRQGQIRYTLVTNHEGRILDDVLVYCLAQPDAPARVLMVVNASNRTKILNWLEQQQGPEQVAVNDLTSTTAMIAVQGPKALELVAPNLDIDVRNLKYYRGSAATWNQIPLLVSRTGYTGEDGCELWVPQEHACEVWEYLMENGQALGVRPVGLGARDTLRLEAAMPLYGHELSEELQPFQAGLGFAVNLQDHEFIGRQALLTAKLDTTAPVRIGLLPEGRRVPREGCTIHAGGQEVGTISSGTFSPTLQRPIAMAYVDRDVMTANSPLEIDVRGRPVAAKITPLPFYSRPH